MTNPKLMSGIFTDGAKLCIDVTQTISVQMLSMLSEEEAIARLDLPYDLYRPGRRIPFYFPPFSGIWFANNNVWSVVKRLNLTDVSLKRYSGGGGSSFGEYSRIGIPPSIFLFNRTCSLIAEGSSTPSIFNADCVFNRSKDNELTLIVHESEESYVISPGSIRYRLTVEPTFVDWLYTIEDSTINDGKVVYTLRATKLGVDLVNIIFDEAIGVK